MAYRKNTYSMVRKNAQTMEEVIEEYIQDMKLASGLNTRLIFNAWDSVSGAAKYTIRRFFKDGTLYITLNSSVVRNQLSFQIPEMINQMNLILSQDSLFQKDDPRVSFVQNLILK